MRGAVLGILAGTALAFGATAANATETLTPINSTVLNAAGTSGPFGAVIVNQSGFTDQFTFHLDSNVFLNGQVGTISLFNLLNINFSTIYVDSIGNAFNKTSGPGDPEQWALTSPLTLSGGAGAIGDHILYVNGSLVNGPGNASYSGTLNIAPVPEPATWALMLLGFGGIGMAMRRRRRPALAQLA